MHATDWQDKAIALFEKTKDSKIFRTFHSEFEIRDSQSAIAVACSGGADSLAALLLTWAKFPDARERLFVLHFDHAVRAESGEDAEFVREVCSALGIGFICEKRVSESGEKLGETELRRARLDFFAREMHARNCKILVQGHQRDDVAETLVMRLTRGAGTDGLAAPRKISRQADGRVFVRPLLDFPKAKIVSALRACEIPWREDSTNAGTDYFRNRVRNRVLPELRAAAPFENIARSRKLAEEDADALDFFANEIYEKIQASPAKRQAVFCLTPDTRCLKLVSFPAIARRVLRKIFAQEKIETDGAAVADALVEAICAGTPLKKQIGDREIVWTGTELRLKEADTARPCENENSSAEFSALPYFFEKVFVTEELFEKIRTGAFSPEETVFLAGTPEIFVRELLPGEKFRPLGAPGEKSVLRIFTDKKIPRERRKNIPVFADGTGIAWIPGLPPAERFRIRAAGTTALRLTYRREALPL
ncbi:MAG: tRNA lysidine(34) synthetase TilS [Opitutales bacterium]|nr:tRNA lysidine(34) synthetase TilS [Opitutales bacterium]